MRKTVLQAVWPNLAFEVQITIKKGLLYNSDQNPTDFSLLAGSKSPKSFKMVPDSKKKTF